MAPGRKRLWSNGSDESALPTTVRVGVDVADSGGDPHAGQLRASSLISVEQDAHVAIPRPSQPSAEPTPFNMSAGDSSGLVYGGQLNVVPVLLMSPTRH